MHKGIDLIELNTINNSLAEVNNLELSEPDKESILSYIENIKKDEGLNTYEKGKLFEDMIAKLLLSTKVFRVLMNKHTSSNEFDILVSLNTNGKYLRSLKIIPEWLPDEFLIECKNHKTTVEVGLVGKFFSLMDVSKVDLGLFISKVGVSGRDSKYWKDAAAFINKINLLYSKHQSPKMILDYNLNDIEIFLKQESSNVIEFITNRKKQLEMDISGGLSNCISPHENEGYFI